MLHCANDFSRSRYKPLDKHIMADLNGLSGGDILRRVMNGLFDHAIETCDRYTTQDTTQAPKMPPTTHHSRRIVFRTDRPVNTTQLMELNQLYREESKVKNEFQDLMLSKIWDPDTPQPIPNLLGNATQQSIQQGPELNTADYLLLTKARLQQITQDVDRHVKGNNLAEFAATQSTMEVPSHVRETLEDFFEEFGKPNSAEVYMLTEALGITAEAVRSFCK